MKSNNRDEFNNPVLPEVFLDESFCNVNHVAVEKPAPIYKAQTIATQHDQYLLYTPPYHPNLQPIELVWATVKNRIRQDPPNNAREAVDMVKAGLDSITSEDWGSVFRHCQKAEFAYEAVGDSAERIEVDQPKRCNTESEEEISEEVNDSE
ncbi:unnamed protein product [Phytophthora fragariaefolia]|uniref:Unnamed protein product n=1 Tax=Phytophthora fragariaefolia TaxID=1490495 RepID=A0A9W6XP21_9STRA|nr:unnamed protein product [Phytophthora fragariaefolia]